MIYNNPWTDFYPIEWGPHLLSNQHKLDTKDSCKRCGTQFMLTIAHDCEKHNHDDHKKTCNTLVLCKTCHYNKDYIKINNCYFGAMMKLYNTKMEKFFNGI